MCDLPSSARLASLFSVPVECSVIKVENYLPELMAEERALARSMGSSRVKGFSSGRVAARRCLNALGVDPYPLLVGTERSPLWPSQVCGSISHCPDICVAAVASHPTMLGLGIDVERRQTLEEGVQRHVLTNQERDLIKTLPPGQDWPCLVFSIKESLFKALHPLFGVWIDFQQAEVSLDLDCESWIATLDYSVVDALEKVRTERAIQSIQHLTLGRYLCTGSHVYSSAEVVVGQ